TGRQGTREARRAPPRNLLHRRLNDQPNALPRSRDGSSPPALYDYDHGPVRTPAIGASKASDPALALDSHGRLVGKGDVKPQTRHILETIKAVLEAAGGSLKDVTFNQIFPIWVVMRQRTKFIGSTFARICRLDTAFAPIWCG